MRDAHDDTEGRKPYRTFKAGKGRRSSLDDELAGARPARPRRESGGAADERRPDARAGTRRAADEPRRGYDVRRADEGRSAPPYQRYESAGTRGPAGGGPTGRSPGGAAPRRRRRFRWWHIPLVLLLALVVAGIVVTVLAWPGYKKFDRAVDKSNGRIDRKTRTQLSPDEGWIWRRGTTILLLGVDSKAGEPARSDTIMLMHFDPGKHTINQLSIPRDTRVEIPGRGMDKINAAMFWGGPALAVKTVRSFLGIPVNHVMVVNFKGFPRLVDAVGGVDMRVPETVSTVAGSNGRIVTFKKGMRHFDGKYAMLYVRIRYADDDLHRAMRQQQFIQALQKKIAQPSNITKLPLIGKRFMSGVDTDLTTNQIITLAYLKWRAGGGRKMLLAGTPGYEGGVAYVFPPSRAKIERQLRRFLNE